MLRGLLIAIAIASVPAAPAARATVLTFDVGNTFNNQDIDQAYGDRVTAVTMGDFKYGAAGGFTPNVTVTYGASKLYTDGYGDLVNVLWMGSGLISLTFRPDPGFAVRVDSFQIAAWQDFSSDPVIREISVSGFGTNFSDRDVVIRRGGHEDYSLDGVPQPITSDDVTILIDASNLAGAQKGWIAIDNVQFRQFEAVPEPAAALLLGAALTLLRRRRAEAARPRPRAV